jgi:hypothetical protein
MPDEDCWEEIGRLRAEVDMLQRWVNEHKNRITELERDKQRLVTIGGVMAFIFTGIGVFFADSVRHVLQKLVN